MAAAATATMMMMMMMIGNVEIIAVREIMKRFPGGG
jgi:hypothetical protein